MFVALRGGLVGTAACSPSMAPFRVVALLCSCSSVCVLAQMPFPEKIAKQLERLAHGHCLACGESTTKKTATGATSCGEAAHICGLKPGSARYDPTQSDAERQSVANGVWLCASCHKHADKDTTDVTKEEMYEWKAREAEVWGMASCPRDPVKEATAQAILNFDFNAVAPPGAREAAVLFGGEAPRSGFQFGGRTTGTGALPSSR
jgi:ribosomal protein L37AE/L43A